MPIAKSELYKILKNSFPNSVIELTELALDEDHYRVEITSELFNNKTLVEQHRLVNESLKGELGDKLHALAIKTRPI